MLSIAADDSPIDPYLDRLNVELFGKRFTLQYRVSEDSVQPISST